MKLGSRLRFWPHVAIPFLRALALIAIRNHTNHAMTGPTSDAKARGEDPPDKEMGMETLATMLLAVGGSSARR